MVKKPNPEDFLKKKKDIIKISERSEVNWKIEDKKQKTVIVINIDPEIKCLLKIIAAKEKTDITRLVLEGINEVLIRRNNPGIA